ncbi:MAG: hypothetical protein O7F71_10645 [Gammaproteobacteria bacterium]|nr:hypothetical protein [Gammaproteobacteria bacterium]
MNDSELDRIQVDLSTIRQITGSTLSFDRWDAKITTLIGGLSMIPAAAALSGVQSRPWLLFAALPAVAGILVMVGRNLWATHPSRNCSHQKRREYRAGTPVMLAVIALLLGFRSWAFAAGAPAAVVNGSVMFFLGLLVLIDGLYTPSRRSAILPGVAAIIAAFVWPFCSMYQLYAIAWGGVGISLLGAGALMLRELSITKADSHVVAD